MKVGIDVLGIQDNHPLHLGDGFFDLPRPKELQRKPIARLDIFRVQLNGLAVGLKGYRDRLVLHLGLLPHRGSQAMMSLSYRRPETEVKMFKNSAQLTAISS